MEPHFEKKQFGNTCTLISLYALICDIRTVQYHSLGSSMRLKKDTVYTKFPTNHVGCFIGMTRSYPWIICSVHIMVHAVIKITREIKQVMQSTNTN